jgi:hypothetical protein
MGSALSKHAGFKSLHVEIENLKIGDVLEKVSKDQSFLDINKVTVTEDTMVNEAIDAASKVFIYIYYIFLFLLRYEKFFDCNI